MYIGSRIFFIFENAQAIRGMDLLMLLVCGLWIIYKYNKPEYGFWMIISCLLSVHLGFIDALVFPFLIIAFYFLQKESLCLRHYHYANRGTPSFLTSDRQKLS